MEELLRLVIYKNKYIFDDISVSISYVRKCINQQCKPKSCLTLPKNNKNKSREIFTIRLNKKGFNAYLLSAYTNELLLSEIYRTSALKFLYEYIKLLTLDEKQYTNKVLLLKLRTPKKQFLDYCWNDKITTMVLEVSEIDHAMSWLSTLGGAFSSLGDEFEHCAKMAGRISARQFELAQRLKNPLLTARCNLYAALSLIQQGKFKLPRFIIQTVYTFAIKEKDIRLQNMCKGIWNKLRYCYKMRKFCILR